MKFTASLLTHLPSLSRLRRGAPERVLVHPMREWVTCLVVAILVGIILFGFAGIDFYMQYTVVDTPTQSEISVPKYREKDAESIIRYYEGKESQFKNLRGVGFLAIPPIVPSETETARGTEAGTTTSPAEVAGDSESQ